MFDTSAILRPEKTDQCMVNLLLVEREKPESRKALFREYTQDFSRSATKSGDRNAVNRLEDEPGSKCLFVTVAMDTASSSLSDSLLSSKL